MSRSYRDLIVWQKSLHLVRVIYEVTSVFPKAEIFGLTAQMRRSAVSIPSNIAEGSKRSSRRDFRNFLINAHASGAELETQIEIAKMLHLGRTERLDQSLQLMDEIMRMLYRMIEQLS